MIEDDVTKSEGVRLADSENVFKEGADTYPAHLPWAAVFNREPCGECAESKKGACRRHWAVYPREVIPFPLGPDADLPCVGLWDQYDREEVTPEVESRCQGCPARAWCLQTAVANNEVGIWAGTTYEQRRVMGLDARLDFPPQTQEEEAA